MVVVIPCYFEPDIISTLQSLTRCDPVSGSVEIIVVVNQSTSAPPEVRKHNDHTIRHINQWINSQTSELSFYVLHQILPERHAGVGLARKIGMDQAFGRFSTLNKDGIIICLDADCTCAGNYLQAILEHFEIHRQTPGCSIYYEHPLEGSLPLEQYRTITAYELHLRYYTHALRYCRLPCAFQTVGSAMAVSASAYQKQGGMNKRKAGEDFYFLQKIIKLGGFTELNTTAVYPSARLSDRVPFGTGKAMIRHTEPGNSQFLTYHPNTFVDLKSFTEHLPGLYRASDPEIVKSWRTFPPAIRGFITLDAFSKQILEFNRKTSSPKTFEKRLFQWFDGLQAFKFANYTRKYHYPEVGVAEASGWLLKKTYGIESAGNDEKILLMQYRALDSRQKMRTIED